MPSQPISRSRCQEQKNINRLTGETGIAMWIRTKDEIKYVREEYVLKPGEKIIGAKEEAAKPKKSRKKKASEQ